MASTSSSLNMNIGDTLYLANIPQAENSISNLINYFCKFGVVKNVHVAYNGDPAASKITFDSNDAAKVAYNNQEAILNNRFISMSWNSPTSGAEPTPVTDQSIGVNCSLCMRVFENTKVRDNHIKRIHNGKGYTCGECNVPFATIKTYNSHVISQRHGSLVQTNFKQTVKSERTPMKVDKLALFTFENQRLRDKKHALKHRLHEIEKVHSKELKKEKEHFETKLKGLFTKYCAYVLYDLNLKPFYFQRKMLHC